jgi:hypothetical protein
MSMTTKQKAFTALRRAARRLDDLTENCGHGEHLRRPAARRALEQAALAYAAAVAAAGVAS